MAIAETLKYSELFDHLGKEQLRKIAPRCCGDNYREGAVIFKEGDEAREIFVLTEGMVALEMEIQPVPNRPAIPMAVEVVGKNEIFGWSALIEPYRYTLTARCMVPSTVLAINGEMFQKVMADDTELGLAVMKRLTEIIAMRLANTRARLTKGIGLIMGKKNLEYPNSQPESNRN
jgi:CRP/FNR family cyclic AMP-dependent transcriptional regulator